MGGALLTLGALTPLAGSLITGAMVTAIRKVHAPNGPWVTKGGWEYNAVLIAAVASLVEHGPGSPSVDAKLFPSLRGPGCGPRSPSAPASPAPTSSPRSSTPRRRRPRRRRAAGEPASPNGVAQPETAGAGA